MTKLIAAFHNFANAPKIPSMETMSYLKTELFRLLGYYTAEVKHRRFGTTYRPIFEGRFGTTYPSHLQGTFGTTYLSQLLGALDA